MIKKVDASIHDLPRSLIQAVQRITISTAGVCAQKMVPNSYDPDLLERASVHARDILEQVMIYGDANLLPATIGDVDRLPHIRGFDPIKKGQYYPQQLGLLVARAGFDTALSLYGESPLRETMDSILCECAVKAGSGFANLYNANEQSVAHIAALTRDFVNEALASDDPKAHIDAIMENILSAAYSGEWPAKLLKARMSSVPDLIMVSTFMALETASMAIGIERLSASISAEISARAIRKERPRTNHSHYSWGHRHHVPHRGHG